jgi:sulfide dehydrogenase [flavocytochrome c] flavoprotein subunit
MNQYSRRDFVKLLGAGGLLACAGGVPATGRAQGSARVVVVGGGYGGAVAAKYLKQLKPDLEVTLVERNKAYVSCPLSNEVLSGERDIKTLYWNYTGLEKHGVKVIHDNAVAVDPAKKTVSLKGGQTLSYDKLVVSPGIDFKWDAVEGFSEKDSAAMPHAYKAGEQTLLLRKQIEAMRDGGTCYIVSPPKPFRCPPGPYERASQIAHYFKKHKPKSKVVILDASDSFSKKGLFEEAWKAMYKDTLTWVGASADGKVLRVEPATKTLVTEFSKHKGDVVNFIPAHHAGKIAVDAGLTDKTGWCPINPSSMESTVQKDIYVIGDACIAGEPAPFDMPKSAHAAATQAKVAAGAIIADLRGYAGPPEPYYVNTCYSLAAPGYGFSVVHIFRVKDGKFEYVKTAGGTSPVGAPAWNRKAEAEFAESWYRNLAADAFS